MIAGLPPRRAARSNEQNRVIHRAGTNTMLGPRDFEPIAIHPRRRGGFVARFLATILLGFSLLFLMLLAMVLVSQFTGGKPAAPWWSLLPIGAVIWVLGFLGTVLWTGRNFPSWFWYALSLVLTTGAAAVALSFLLKGGLADIGLWLPMVFGL